MFNVKKQTLFAYFSLQTSLGN